MFARKAVELVQEVARCDPDQILPFDADGVQRVLEEAHEHHQHMVQILLRVQGSGVEWRETRSEDATAVMVHHQALLRNKRCLLAYLNARMDQIRRLRWQLGATLPSALQERLSPSEGEWFVQYSQALGDYMVAAGLDLTVDLSPPKDPYIEVRVLKDAGAMYLDDKVAYLEANTLHLVRKTDAEPLILKGLLEHREY
ncbi:hypothetical protein CLOM_g15408 [Closterium sp. NIES-68]|nr:hypothetical protein CLOM_g15408 [Closterium sp. NIES-68]GJP65664.1 hypothetical protein CLOP_g22531 [Closterium sp. NIES-67]